jgi:hypothetical protein
MMAKPRAASMVSSTGLNMVVSSENLKDDNSVADSDSRMDAWKAAYSE